MSGYITITDLIKCILGDNDVQLVYSTKKCLKGDLDKMFITENLTNFKTNLVKELAELKCNHDINAYWTNDDRIYAKKI